MLLVISIPSSSVIPLQIQSICLLWTWYFQTVEDFDPPTWSAFAFLIPPLLTYRGTKRLPILYYMSRLNNNLCHHCRQMKKMIRVVGFFPIKYIFQPSKDLHSLGQDTFNAISHVMKKWVFF